MKLAEKQEKIGAQRRGMVRSGNRSEKIRTYNFKDNRVTDHRINLTLHKLDRVMQGDLDDLVNALIAAERAAQLNGGSETSGGRSARASSSPPTISRSTALIPRASTPRSSSPTRLGCEGSTSTCNSIARRPHKTL